MGDQEQQKPVVIQQGGNGVGLVLAALIMGGAIVYAVNIWSNTQQQRLRVPAETIQKGVETVKEAIKPGSGSLITLIIILKTTKYSLKESKAFNQSRASVNIT